MLEKNCNNKLERFVYNKPWAVASNFRKIKRPDNTKSNFFLFAKLSQTV